MARELTVKVVGDVDNYRRSLRRATDDTDRFGGKIRMVGSTGPRAFRAIGIGAGAVAVGGVAALSLAVGAVTKDLADHDAANKQTEAVIKSTGDAANVTSSHIADLAGEIENLSGQDDVAVQKGENMLLTFTNIKNGVGDGNQVFDDATKIMADMSAAMGTDMAGQAVQLGKALNDPIKGISALSRVGVTFTAAQKNVIKSMVDSGNTMGAQKVILKELNKEFGGSAEAMGQSLPGQIERLKAQFFNLGDAILAGIIPALTQVTSWVLENWPAWQATIQQYAQLVMDWFHENWPQIKAVILEVFDAAKQAWYETLKPALEDLYNYEVWLVGQIREHWSQIEGILGGAFTIIQGLFDVFSGLIKGDWDQFWDGIKQVVSGAMTLLKNTITLAWDIIKGVMSTLGERAKAGIEEGLGNLGDWAAGKLGNLRTAIDNAIESIPGRMEALGLALLHALGTGVGNLLAWGAEKAADLGEGIISKAEQVAGKAGELAGRIIPGLKDGIGDIAAWAAGKAGEIPGALWSKAQEIFDKASALGGRIVAGIKSGLESVASGIGGAISSAINAVIDSFNNLSIPGFSMGLNINTHIPGVGTKGFDIGFPSIPLPDLPRLAEGGTSTRPGWAMVGERGPEVLFMNKGATVAPLQGNGVTVNLYGYQLPQGNAAAAAAHIGARIRRG